MTSLRSKSSSPTWIACLIIWLSAADSSDSLLSVAVAGRSHHTPLAASYASGRLRPPSAVGASAGASR
eukprot:6202430-Pleurochrysis_carterae.AAC.1